MNYKIWVIRKIAVEYNDGNHYLDHNSINGKAHSFFNSQEEAMNAWHKLEVANARNNSWWNQYLGYEIRDALSNRDIKNKLGEEMLACAKEKDFEYYDDWTVEEFYNIKFIDYYQTDVFNLLNDDLVVKVLLIAQVNRYKVVECQKNSGSYVIEWNKNPSLRETDDNNSNISTRCNKCRVLTSWSEQKAYWTEFVTDYWGDVRLKCFTVLDADIFKMNFQRDYTYSCPEHTFLLEIKGLLTALTDQPSIVNSLLTRQEDYLYNPEENILVIKTAKGLFNINPLLKNPIFEIRQLTIEQILKIEAGLAEYV